MTCTDPPADPPAAPSVADYVRAALEQIHAAELVLRHDAQPARTMIVHELVSAAVSLGRVLHLVAGAR